MNKIGFSHLTLHVIAHKAKTFKGPLLLGPDVVNCGKYSGAEFHVNHELISSSYRGERLIDNGPTEVAK